MVRVDNITELEMTQSILPDSGERVSYGEGCAVREPDTGKGRYDLISPFALRRMALHYENGSRKYTRIVEINKEELLSAVEKELEKSLRAECVVSINYIAKECVEVAMKNSCAQEIWNMHHDNEITQTTGEESIQNGSEMQIEGEGKTQFVETEIERPRENHGSEKSVLQKRHIKAYLKNKIINVQSVEDLSTMLEQFILTMTIKQEMQEDCYVVGATTDLECLKNLLVLCKKLSPTFAIQQQQNSYILTISGDRNWEKGMKFSRYVNSALRHMWKFVMGMNDEDHLAAAAWNIFAIMHHQELGQFEFNDMPHYECKYEHE